MIRNSGEFMENTLRRETPAHILPRICWLDTCQMKDFEHAYQRWLNTLTMDSHHCDATAARNALIDILGKLRSKYPEAQLQSCETTGQSKMSLFLTTPD